MKNNSPGTSPHNAAPFYADLVKHIPPPENLGPCGSCKFWVLSEAFRICHTPAGAKRVSDLIKEGHNIPPEKIQFVSQCSFTPTWALTSDDHWCGQYSRAPAVMAVKPVPWKLPEGDYGDRAPNRDPGDALAWCPFCKKEHAGGATCMGHHP